jgi:hypothetical protein
MIMPISDVADTPFYVLLDGNHRIGPNIVKLDAGVECSPIYGFLNKGTYDKFCMNHQQSLKPYPLVKGYLRNQVCAPGDGLQLVALDAAGPREPHLYAATVEAVLEAHENRTTHVAAAYQLILDQEANAYRVKETSV